jgi:hypothetical protein
MHGFEPDIGAQLTLGRLTRISVGVLHLTELCLELPSLFSRPSSFVVNLPLQHRQVFDQQHDAYDAGDATKYTDPKQTSGPSRYILLGVQVCLIMLLLILSGTLLYYAVRYRWAPSQAHRKTILLCLSVIAACGAGIGALATALAMSP